ncbi:MAG: RNA polymerase sigma factor [Bacteroidia bacterium]
MSGIDTDQKILKLIGNPDTERSGFQLLYTTYAKRLYWHLRGILKNHEDADDVLQDVLVKSWKGLKNFRGDSALYSWLYRIGTNECITFLKRREKNMSLSIHGDDTRLEETIEAKTDIDTSKTLALLQQALDLLPEKQKQVFCLRYYDELTYKEIAEKLGTSIGALKASYHHAVSKIQEHILKHD